MAEPEWGGTFLLTNYKRDIEPHLHVIISDPTKNPDAIVTANFTSWRADKDQSCVVGPGEHPWLTKRSCIDYRRDRLITSEEYRTLTESRLVIPQEPVGASLLQRILGGAAVSPHIPLESREILADQNLIDDE